LCLFRVRVVVREAVEADGAGVIREEWVVVFRMPLFCQAYEESPVKEKPAL
jgi:hypothetical protein